MEIYVKIYFIYEFSLFFLYTITTGSHTLILPPYRSFKHIYCWVHKLCHTYSIKYRHL